MKRLVVVSAALAVVGGLAPWNGAADGADNADNARSAGAGVAPVAK